QHHVLLADEYGCLLGASLLGGGAKTFKGRILRRQGRQDPGFRHSFPARDLRGAAVLGNTRVFKSHLLQATRQGHSLRGLGTTGAVDSRSPREFHVVAVSTPEERLK